MSDEEDYFRKLDQEAKARLKSMLDAEQDAAAREARKDLHFHKCGKCGSDMTTQAFRGIEIEVCSNCGAVLLDPGELQQLAGKDTTDVITSFFGMFGGGSSDG
ncbi:MAG: zf-TFIIB domain-containing protein [Myxococcales bacterium]|nr:zf-TFIIB domain-containing protein [Myxococcales bacterium]